ncbi:MAG: SUMF1/EgtB/PvdO family nonheme iron enzyme [Halieaceae bacterium]|nr:SUMF1/EgtB/PvdO family nonheme iron enzyme [Halieaceae bacterium]
MGCFSEVRCTYRSTRHFPVSRDRLMRGQAHRRRVLRGGSFNNNDRNVRCAYRNNRHPHNRNNNVGFRVVFSTLFSPELPGGCGRPQWSLERSRTRNNGGACSWPQLHPL